MVVAVLRTLCLTFCFCEALCYSQLKFLVLMDAADLPSVQQAGAALLKSNSAKVSFEYQVVSPRESLQSLVTDVCNGLPLSGIACLSSLPHLRCLAASLATRLNLAFVAASIASDSPTIACGPEPATVQLPMRHFLLSVGPFASRMNLTGFSAAVVLFDHTWDPTSLLPGKNFPGPAYLYRLTRNASELPNFLESVRNRTRATLFVLAAEAALAEATLTAAERVRLTTRFFTWFHLNAGLSGLRTQQPVYQVTFLLDDTASAVAMATQANRTGSGEAARFATQWASLSLMLAATKTLLATETGPEQSFDNLPSNCGVIGNTSISNYSDVLTRSFGAALLQATNVSLLIGSKPTVSTQPLVKLQYNLHLQYCVNSYCSSTGWGYSTGSSDSGTVIQLPSEVANASALPQRARLKLKVLTVPEKPFVFYENGTYSGYSIAVLDSIAKQLDFDYVITQPPDGAYGALLPNGSWNGMIGQLVALEADVAIGPISVTAERQRTVDFTIPYYDYAGLQIFMRRLEGGAEASMFFFVRVFDGWVWLCLGLTLLITGLLVTLFDKLSPYSFQNRSEEELAEGEPEGKIFSFKESMWFVLGAVTQAGESFDPRATSTRFLVAGFWIFSCIIMALYTANLAAFLTVSKLTASISSVRELASQTSIKYSVQRDTIGYAFFAQMRDIETKFYNVWRDLTVQPEFSSSVNAGGSLYTVWEYPIEEQYTDMFRRMSGWGFFNTTDEAIRLIRTGGWAMFMETPLIKYYMGKDCELTSTGEILSSRPYGIALQKNSPLTSLFNMAILNMQNDRSLESFKVFWWEREKVQCPSDKVTSGVQLQTLSGVFVLLGAGIGAGFIVLIIEFIVAKVWGTERFKPESMIVTHLAPRPASFRRSLRRASHCSGGGNAGGTDSHSDKLSVSRSGACKSPSRLSIQNGGHGDREHQQAGHEGRGHRGNSGADAGEDNAGFMMDELSPPERAVAAAVNSVDETDNPGPDDERHSHKFL